MFCNGRKNAVLLARKRVYCEMGIGVVEENVDGILVVGLDVV